MTARISFQRTKAVISAPTMMSGRKRIGADPLDQQAVLDCVQIGGSCPFPFIDMGNRHNRAPPSTTW